MLLCQHCPYRHITCINMHSKRLIKLWHTQNGSRCERTLECFKCLLLWPSPVKLSLFLQQCGQRRNQLGVPHDKPVVIIAKPKERLQLANRGGYRPLSNCPNFLRVHLYLPCLNNMPKILDTPLVDVTLGSLGLQRILPEALQCLSHICQVLCS